MEGRRKMIAATSPRLTPADLQEEIIADEGEVLAVYLCPAGHKTCGVGHLVLSSDPEYDLPLGTVITKARCRELLDRDLEITLSECEKLLPRFADLPVEVQKVLANMTYNIGRPRLSLFKKCLAAIETGDWPTAANEMQDSLWARQLPARSGRLINRMRNV
jgi:lysozyme